MTATVRNVHAWEPPIQWSNRRSNWRDYPRGYKALLSVGRTTPLQPWVEEAELQELERRYPSHTSAPEKGDLSPSQRLDLVATKMLSMSVSGVVSFADKSDILTVWKARLRAERELPVPDPDIFSHRDRHTDRTMRLQVDSWWGLGIAAFEEKP